MPYMLHVLKENPETSSKWQLVVIFLPSNCVVALQISSKRVDVFHKIWWCHILKVTALFFFLQKNKLMCSGGSKWQPYSHPSSAWWIPLTKSGGAKIWAWRGFFSGSVLCKIHRCSLDGDLLVRQLKL